ncbi:hypothetical protein ABIB82_003923 [Bradyrhizobium sp. i1.8.4]|uniref:hypothetical protein n=1 Tax=unclassified Bradyrhizobium TaxID=2631580 RepID=UPI003D1C4625
MNFNRVALFQYMNRFSVGSKPRGSPWPSGQLVISPRAYLFDNGEYVDVTREGFYTLFTNSGTSFDAGNVIVYQSDVMLLMASLARACGYGISDESLTNVQRASVARARALWMRCGATVSFVEYWCQQLGITYRSVFFLTGNSASTPGIDVNLDVYDDSFDVGHSLIEVSLGGQWVLVDVSTNVAFKDAAGNWLSLKSVVAAGMSNCVRVDLADYDIEQQNYSGNFMPGIYANIRTWPQNIDRWRRGIY